MVLGEREPVPQAIKIMAKEEGTLELDNLSSFLYDLVLLHDRLLLSLSDEYDYRYHSSLYFYRRGGRRIKKTDKLFVKQITKESPFVILMVIGAAASVVGLSWTLIKILEKLRDWKVDEEIKRLQRENLSLDKYIKQQELRSLLEDHVGQKLLEKYPDEVEEIINRTIRDALRLSENEQLKITEVKTLDIEGNN